MSVGLANTYMDSQKLDALLSEPCIFYGYASVPKWPQKQSQSIKFKKNFWGACPQTPLVIQHAHGQELCLKPRLHRPYSLSSVAGQIAAWSSCVSAAMIILIHSYV